MRFILQIIILIFIYLTAFSQEEVVICDQIWTTKNLDVDQYSNGDPIRHAKTDAEWRDAGAKGEGAWCYYNNDSALGLIYGKLYNWYAVNDPRGLAQDGWHIPSDVEWKELEMCLGMNLTEADNTGMRGTDQGAQLAGRADLWTIEAIKNNSNFGSSGFSALPGGFRATYGSFHHIGINACWWSSSESSTEAWIRDILQNPQVRRITSGKAEGNSIRCVWDFPTGTNKLSDTSDNLWAIIKPLAESQDIDMKQVFINTTKDSVISGYIRNTGTADIRIDSIKFVAGDTALFDLVSGFPPYSIPVGGQKDVEFRFWPKSVGDKSADIFIYTQSDTLKQKIIGEGINNYLEVKAKLVDFDTVRIGTFRDSVLILLKNIGPSDVFITSTDLLGPDKDQFVIDSGGGSFNIASGADRELKVKFAPIEKGRTSGQIGFYYKGIGSPAIAYLYGEGVGPYITAIPDIYYPRLICESNTDTTIKIQNIGDASLIIPTYNLTGTHPNDFELVNPFQSMDIASDSSVTLVMRFKPTDSGIRSAILNFSSNMYPDSIISIPLEGVKDSVDISVSHTFIDLGTLCPNESKDTSVTVQNIGTILTGINAANSQYFILDVNNFNLDTNQARTIAISFAGSPNQGVISEQLVFTDSICGYTKTIDVTVTIAATEIQGADLILNAIVGANDEGIVTVNNLSDQAVEIAGPKIDPPFVIIDPQFPVTIPAQGSIDITLRYSPTDTLIAKDTLILFGQPCDAIDSCTITGFPSSASAILQVGSAQAEPGDSILIPVYLRNPQNVVKSEATGFRTNLSFNSTLLDPIDYPKILIEDNVTTIELDSLPAVPDENSILRYVRFVVGLGNTNETELTLTNYEAIGGIVAMDTIGGKFTLLGICPEGGDRLLDPGTGQVSLKVNPNPAKESAEIELELVERGWTQLFITNILGETAIKLIEGITETGKHKITINTDKLSSGTYFLILRTPTEQRTKRMEVVR